jgi:putative transposase
MFNICGRFCCWNFQVTRQSGFAFLCSEIKRVRVVRRADGYGTQFCIDVEGTEQFIPTGKAIGIDVGLNHFYTDSDHNTIPNPRYLRKSEKALKRLPKGISRKKRGSSNRKKAIDKLGKNT